jgi:hypothetical protein
MKLDTGRMGTFCRCSWCSKCTFWPCSPCLDCSSRSHSSTLRLVSTPREKTFDCLCCFCSCHFHPVSNSSRFSLCSVEKSVKPTIVGLIVFMSTIWAPVDKLLSFCLTLNTRKNEFQADQYSVNLGYGAFSSVKFTKTFFSVLSLFKTSCARLLTRPAAQDGAH